MKGGSLDIIIGCMFSGKSTELVRKAERFKYIGYRVCYVNSIKDTRSEQAYGHYKGIRLGKITNHNKKSTDCFMCHDLGELLVLIDEFDVFAVDECQFFSDLNMICTLVNTHGKKVIVSGLDGDSNRNEFGNILKIIPQCDTITKLHALCFICQDGTPGIFSKRMIQSDEQECIGGNESYKAVCRNCFHN